MKFRHLAAWFSGVILLGTAATLLHAQPPQPARLDRAKLRAEVVKLRVEVEMLRFDYELAHNDLLEDLKMTKGLRMLGPMMQLGGAIQSAMSGETPPRPSEKERKKAAEEAKKAEQEEKQQEAQVAAFVAERKKELSRRFGLLEEKRLDLEDAERNYRESFR